MKKPYLKSIYLYPILFTANIVLTIAGANLVNLTYYEIIQDTLLLCFLVGLVFGLVYLVNRDGQRASFLVFLGTLWAAYFGVVVSVLKNRTGLSMDIEQQILLLVIWSGMFLFIGNPWLWHHVRKPGTITAYMNILMVILIVLSLVRIQSYQRANVALHQYESTFPTINNLQAPKQPPDIYYIIVDGYGQADTLSKIYDWDNSAFLDYLTKAGFYIARESRTNYVQTGLSLASSLNFDYLPSFPENSRDGRPLEYFIQHSRLLITLENLGYSTYTFQTPYEPTNITQADHFYASVHMVRTKALLGLLMMNSIASILIDLNLIKPPLSNYGEQQSLVSNNLSRLGSIAELPGPKFVFLHLLIPHPSFIFDEEGPITPEEVYILSDADLFQGTAQQYIAGYTSQATYLNQALEKLLESVLSKSPSLPVIILQGDHGPGAYFTQSIDQTCLQERFGILNAYLLPQIDPERLYSSISPVNTFRLILDAYFGANLDLLPDQHYYSNFIQPYHFIAVEDEINKPCNIP